jgi:hypothetical protein
MAAKRHLSDRGEPSEFESIAGLNDESGLGQVVLGRYCLQGRIWNPVVQQAYGCRVSGENLGSE